MKIVVDPLRPFFDYVICRVNTAWFSLLGVLAAFNLIIIAAGVYLAIRIRVIPYNYYNESKGPQTKKKTNRSDTAFL